jgi:predicted enzyme related to lactoylglutathione lyase
MTSISFFELGVDDADRARAFYGALFGWTFETGPAMKGFAISTPGVPGGMHPGDKGAWPYVFFRVEDMDAALERVVELGGEVQDAFDDDPEENVKRFGRFKFVKDDQGSPFGLHQPPSA